MAIFTRRTLQDCLDGNAAFVGRKEAKAQVRKLNMMDGAEAAITAEWEVVLLHAFS